MSPEEVREKIGFEVMTSWMEYHGFSSKCRECRAKADRKGEDKKHCSWSRKQLAGH